MKEFMTISETTEIKLPRAERRKFRMNVTGPCAIFGAGKYGNCIYHGFGSAKVNTVIEGDAILVVPQKGATVTLFIPELRDLTVEWANSESYTDLSPKPFGTISPEIQAIIDKMNRNAIIREQAMLRALGNREQ